MKKLSREAIVLIILGAILLVGITTGAIRHGIRSRIQLQAVTRAPLMIPLNSATVEDLCRLPGIGTELASRIITYRTEHGDFTHLDSLLNVEGIGQVKLSEIKPYLQVP